MFPFQRILYPVDFSEPCMSVVPHVQRLAMHFSATLTLLHVYEPNLQIYDEIGTVVDTSPDLLKLEVQRLKEFSAAHFPGLHTTQLVEQGEPGAVIRETVQRNGMDLVMMSTRGRGAFRRLLLGSVTAKVLHDVSCAVWTGVHSSLSDHSSPVPYRCVLCAVGLDPETPDVLRAASALASSFDAKLHVVHCVETPPMSLEIDFAPYRQRLLDSADLELRLILRNTGIEATLSVLEGAIDARVRKEALDRSADLIVTGRGHHQGKLSRMFSQLYSIVRESPCPVLSV
ncbi:MAG: universal stress protein [Bryobacteraceae bacterium]